MRAQAAFEYMMLFGIILLIIVPIASYVWHQNEISSRIRQGKIAVDSLVTAVDPMYAQGPGAKIVIGIVFPSGYNSDKSSISNQTIKLHVITPAGTNDLIGKTKGDVNGSLPISNGYKSITLEMINGYVNITSS